MATQAAPPSVQSSVATEVSLRQGPTMQGGRQLTSTSQQEVQSPSAQPQPMPERTSNKSISTALDGPGPPLLPSSEAPPQQPFLSARDARTARRRLDVAGASTNSGVQGSQNLPPANSPSRSMRTPSVLGSDQGHQARISRLTARALARGGSVRDSASERSSKVVKDVYRDERGRRVERPKVVKSDVHMIGEIVGASDFMRSQRTLFCRYRLVYDGVKSWAVVRGLEQGCTHVSSPSDSDDDFVVWEHPLDVHMTTQKLEGWPSLLLMVYARDDSSCKDLFVSYALCPLPNTPGIHHLTLRTWYPVERRKLNVRSIFSRYMGMAARLDDDLLDLGYATDVQKREDGGPYISSVGSGCVHLRLQMMFRHLSGLTHQMGDNLYKSLENFQMHLEEGRKKELHKKAALDEHRDAQQRPQMSEGLKQLREGRAARFEQAAKALDRRSATPSHDGSVKGGDITRTSRSDQAGGRGSGTQSAPPRTRENRTSTFTAGGGGGNGPEPSGPSGTSVGVARTPDQTTPRERGGAGVSGRGSGLAGEGTGTHSRQPSGDDVLSDRQAERERRRQGSGTGGALGR